MKTSIILLITAVFLFHSCGNGTEQNVPETETNIVEEDNAIAENDNAKEWLESIFKCKDSDGYCYYLDDEKSILTERFFEFLVDALEIYGPTNLTEEELPQAEKEYKEKWSGIYPLYSEEMMPFGRGNDDSLNIRDVKIEKISDLKYSVFIDYDGETKTQSEVTLIVVNNSYKIDYCKSEFIE